MASKFKIKLKLQGLELEVEGTRDEIPMIAQSLSSQLTGMLSPMAALASMPDPKAALGPKTPTDETSAEDVTPPKKKGTTSRRATPKSNSSSTSSPEPSAVDWSHDPEKWGYPKQDWTAAEKALWLLYVVENEKQLTELSATQISNSFNKHFKQAKTIKSFTVTRDLGRKKTGKDSPVGENTTNNPSLWYLTTSGKALAAKMIEDLRSK